MAIENFSDLGLGAETKKEDISSIIQEVLGITIEDLTNKLSANVAANAAKLAEQIINIAPHNNYAKLLETDVDKANFLQTEAHKSEYWDLREIKASDKIDNLLVFTFMNTAVDDGASLKGCVYVTFTGKIKYAFATVN
jgi:hypothetical protein